MKEPQVTVGLYRHFKGAYYYVTNVSRHAHNLDEHLVNYFNVCHPEYGNYSRPLNDFIATVEEDGRIIKDRPDNITGQTPRFQRIHDLNWEIASVSTTDLISELRTRNDSPIHEVDIEGLMSPVVAKDYVVGDYYEATEDIPEGVATLVAFTTEEEAKRYFATHMGRANTKVYKRTFIEV